MECKVSKAKSRDTELKIGIYPEWNVKLDIIPVSVLDRIHWNISRMECKAIKVIFKLSAGAFIGIYPEWNVKGQCVIIMM